MKNSKEWEQAYKVAQKIYKPIFKAQKKQLIKYAKEFQPYDYGFMEKLLFQSIKIYYDFYRNKGLLYQDTDCEFNHWEELVDSLKTCVEIINKIETVAYDTWEEEYSLREKLYETIKLHYSSWWD